jgi:hypothetical protein
MKTLVGQKLSGPMVGTTDWDSVKKGMKDKEEKDEEYNLPILWECRDCKMYSFLKSKCGKNYGTTPDGCKEFRLP